MMRNRNSPVLAEGLKMYQFLAELFPITRSLTGRGVRETLSRIQMHIPIALHEIPSGTRVFDWTVPDEWIIDEAYLTDKKGKKIIDIRSNNLHVVGYSIPVDRWLPLSELQDHLYSLVNQPNAIPYVTSYYKKHWGFCLTHQQRKSLKSGSYHAVIKSQLKPGHLTYAEYVIPGKTTQEVFFSTYVCHPSMANNELSGPTVSTFLAKWAASAPRKYTYRFIFIPETIGSIAYLSRHLPALKRNMIAGFNLSCVGDDRTYSIVHSRYANTYADKVLKCVLNFRHPQHADYSFLQRGSDERQYGSPGVDLPLVGFCRSLYGAFPEYHTSLDNLDVVSPAGLMGSLYVLKDCIELIENNAQYQLQCLGEPQLGKRGLYPTVSMKRSADTTTTMMNFMAYADATNDLIDIAGLIHAAPWELYPIIEDLKKHDLIKATPS
jgi:aminopeptidase-like protein